MRSNPLKATMKTAVLAATILLLAAGIAVAQSSVNLTATRQTTTLPDGKTVPMWGYVCGAVTAATCTAPNGLAQVGWQPPVITVPYAGANTSLSIVLNNALPVETSIVIFGQFNSDLGNPVRETSPRLHPTQNSTTWPVNGGATFTPPDQAKRVRSFGAQEVPANTVNGPTYTWSSLRPGTYLIESGTYPSIQGPMGLYGVLVVTQAPVVTAGPPPAVTTAGTAYTGITYDSDAVVLLSEIDAVQNAAADAASQSSAFDETKKWTPACGVPPTGNNTCYPPAVNYTPMYYLINGVSFDQSAVGASTLQLSTALSTGNVLVRFVNAGLRMHVPSVLGLDMGLIAEDGNVHPDVALALNKGLTPKPKTQNEVFLPAGKVFDVMVHPPQAAGAYTAAAYPIFDRALGTSEGAVRHGSGMLSYLEMGAAPISGAGALPAAISAQANADTFTVPLNATTFTGNVLLNDIGISNAAAAGTCAATAPYTPSTAAQPITTANGNSVTLNPDGSFTLTVTKSLANDSFSYCGNGNASAATTALVTFNGAAANTVIANNDSYVSNVAALFHSGAPGVLANDTDSKNYPLTASFASGSNPTLNPDGSSTATFGNLKVTLFPNGSFTAIPSVPGGQYAFSYVATNSQGVTATANVSLTFQAGSGLSVKVVDTQTGVELKDYRWVIEQDMTYHSAPGTTTPPPQQTLATSFHRSYMPVVASGCTGTQSCESGQSVYNPATGTHDTVDAKPITLPSQVNLPLTDQTGVACVGVGNPVGCNPNFGNPIYYYISVLPGDAANPVVNGYSGSPTACQLGAAHPELINPNDPNAPAVDPSFCGHEMGGSPILSPLAAGQQAYAPVTVTVQPNPLPPAQLSIFVYEDNNPTNGDVDGVEEQQGLGGFQVILNDVAGSTGLPTGQMTYDMFNMPLTNALVGTPGCPDSSESVAGTPGGSNTLVGMIITCPNPPVRVRPRRSDFPPGNAGTQQFIQALAAYNARVAQDVVDYALAGHALIKNLFPNRFDVLVTPGAGREAAGEQWLQTSTLEGTHANDAFAKLGEPAYFQEFGSPGVHSFVGFVNPAHIARANRALRGQKHAVSGKVTNLHMSRPWSMALFDSGSHDPLAATACYVGLNSANGTGENVSFAACDGDGNFVLPGVPDGQYQLVVWDQWQDQILEYQNVNVNGADVPPQDYPVFSWFQTINTRTYLDNGADNPGLNQVGVAIRFRDGQFAYQSPTDNNGYAAFPETFPLFSWYVVETDTTRFKGSKVNIINDSGAAVDSASQTYGTAQGFSTDIQTGGVLNSTEQFSPLPASLQVPGATYMAGKTVRHDPGNVITEGFQAFISQPQFVEFAKTPYAIGENGGISGHVAYGSTRPFDDPQQLFQNLWEPLVPNVTVNLYQESTAADGTTTLTLIDSTKTTSWDGWVNGTHPDPTNPAAQVPNMNCPGQDPSDPYYTYTLGAANRYKCYDGFHNWNQMEPAPYDGMYAFPTANCTKQVGGSGPGCVANPASPTIAPGPGQQPQQQWSQYILTPGKYVTEVVLPPGFEVVKEEDKNILIGDTYIAPAISQFAGLGDIFILPDQAMLDANLNAPVNSDGIPNNASTNMGRIGNTTFGPGGLIVMEAPCVGQLRIVPDYLSLFTGAQQVAPFAGASRHLCDRKEITLEDQMQAKADFFIFTPTPKASKFTGMILDDLSAEFNTSAPDFGEKFAVPFLPVAFRDFNGIEVNRIYADQFGMYNGMVYSTFDVNPPNPTGYAPNMMITCMNDPGPIVDRRPGSTTFGQSITDPMYNPQYSNFCYTLPFMPGTTAYLDTPVLPTAAFAAGYNPVDCAYPDATPAIARVDGSDAQAAGGFGPWLSGSGAGKSLTITALGDVTVANNAYSGPSASSVGLANQSTIKRHYGFGTQCTAVGGACSAVSTVKVGNTTLGITSWTDTQIVATVPSGASTGELSITAGNGKTSVDTVTVTIEAKTPAFVDPPSPTLGTPDGLAHPIQDAIDKAAPGDLIILNGGITPSAAAPNTVCGKAPSTNCLASAANYPELVIMWKPVRLQGVGAPSVIINATKYPTQKLEQWRSRINTLFGVDAAGNAIPGTSQADPLPGQEITGAIVLLEPSVLGTEEGAGITVTAKNLGRNQCSGQAGQSNFLCHASRIDGVSITGGDAGGGIYVNGWAHNLEIANNRVYGNAGTFTGGVRIGQPYLEGQTGLGPFNYDMNINVHHNSITENGTVEANNGQGGAGGGLSMCSGTDNYHVNYNFICGNFALGDGGGVGHIGLSWNGDISHNWILFNQTFNQSSTTSGGGLVIEGEPSTTGTLSLGSGSVVVDSNLIQGNDAEGGFGAGVRLQDVNGNDVDFNSNSPNLWWRVALTNNIIVNNVAGWAGGGISLYNTANSQIINNTVASNDATATAGPAIALNATPTTPSAHSNPQPAGIVTEAHSAALRAAFGNGVSQSLTRFSNPLLENNIVWKNRSFNINITGSGANPGTPATITLLPTLNTPAGSAAGYCPTGASYWDLGLLGDTSSTSHPNGRLNPTTSVLTSTSDYTGNGNTQNDPVLNMYCNGPRVNPGIPDSTPPNPAFRFQVAGAEDEGGNWVNLRFGPLSLSDPSKYTTAGTVLPMLGDYRIAAGSSALDAGSSNLAPNHDFFGTSRPQGAGYDIGAHELAAAGGGQTSSATLTPASWSPTQTRNCPGITLAQRAACALDPSQAFTLTNTGNVPLTGIGNGVLSGANVADYTIVRLGSTCGPAGNGQLIGITTLQPNATCVVRVQFKPLTAESAGVKNANISVTDSAGTQTSTLSGQAN